MRVKLTKSQRDLLNIGHKLHTSDGYAYYYIPFGLNQQINLIYLNNII